MAYSIWQRKNWEEFNLPNPIKVEGLVDQLIKTKPRLRRYLRNTIDETFHHLILIRNDYAFKSDDEIYPGDRIVVMMPLTGDNLGKMN